MTFFNCLHLNLYLSSPISATRQTIVTAQTAFHLYTFQVITAHFVHHCTLKRWYCTRILTETPLFCLCLQWLPIFSFHGQWRLTCPPHAPASYNAGLTRREPGYIIGALSLT